MSWWVGISCDQDATDIVFATNWAAVRDERSGILLTLFRAHLRFCAILRYLKVPAMHLWVLASSVKKPFFYSSTWYLSCQGWGERIGTRDMTEPPSPENNIIRTFWTNPKKTMDNPSPSMNNSCISVDCPNNQKTPMDWPWGYLWIIHG